MHDQVTEAPKEVKRSRKLNVCEGICYGDVSIIRDIILVFDVDPIGSQVTLKRKETDVECDMKRQGSCYSRLVILHVPWQGSGPQPSTEVLTFGLVYNNQVY